jgi:hypothetical protein
MERLCALTVRDDLELEMKVSRASIEGITLTME